MTIEGERRHRCGWVVIRLTPEEAAVFAFEGKAALSTATGEDERDIELELRRASDLAEGKR